MQRDSHGAVIGAQVLTINPGAGVLTLKGFSPTFERSPAPPTASNANPNIVLSAVPKDLRSPTSAGRSEDLRQGSGTSQILPLVLLTPTVLLQHRLHYPHSNEQSNPAPATSRNGLRRLAPGWLQILRIDACST